MIRLLRLAIFPILMLIQSLVFGQTLINTSFEDYTDGNVFGQDNWIEDNDNNGSAVIISDAVYANTGSKGLKISSTTAVETVVDYLSFGKNETGLNANVYFDFWVKMISFPAGGESVYIRMYDYLPDGGIRRAAELRLYPDGDLKVIGEDSYEVSSVFAVDSWVRVSASIDYALLTFEVAIDGVVLEDDGNTSFGFREDYDPIDKGRDSGIKEYHGLRFWYEDDIADFAIDDMYIGEDAIEDIAFTEPTLDRIITVEQPDRATITLDPQKEIYQVGDVVTASINEVETHYIFDGWTGSFSGTDNPLTINVSSNVTIGAVIIIDELNPPAEYTIDITQPTGGTITVDPSQGPYYEGAIVEFEVVSGIGYEFDSWNGISGEGTQVEVIVTENLTVSANMVLGNFTKRTVNVSTTSELEDAMRNMLPGDSIVLADGTYNDVNRGLEYLGGTIDYPVYIIAANQGMAKITGESKFNLENCAHIIIRGLDIDVDGVNNIFKLTDSNNIRICYNNISSSKPDGSSKWFEIGGIWNADECFSHHNRIDHNLIEGKLDGGALLVIGGNSGDPVPAISQYDRIDHNHFKNVGPRQTNEKETIRIGWSKISLLSAYCTVEYNLFEACDGDPEIISVKSCDNYVRNNTFSRSLGTVSLRHGDRTEVSGNYFFGKEKTADFDGKIIGCGGVRVYGKDHKIFNNYFEGLTGYRWDAACTITQGDANNDGINQGSDLTKHYIPENLEFTHNTFINNYSDIEIGYDNSGKYSKAPKNILIANNIVVQDANPVTILHTDGADDDVSFADNIFYTSGTGSWGDISFDASEAKNEDPLLEASNCRIPLVDCEDEYPNAVFKISGTNSPAYNPSPANTITEAINDIEGQSSVGVRDLGADEYNDADEITNGALDHRHVGPNAVPFSETSTVIHEYEITLEQADGGTITISPTTGPYPEGSTVTFTATPEANYSFTSWIGISGDNAIQEINVYSDLNVSAIFTSGISEHTIELIQTTGGTISIDPATGPYLSGSIVTFTAIPDAEYAFEAWSGINGTSAVEEVTVNGNLIVEASFEILSAIGNEFGQLVDAYPNPFENSITLKTQNSAVVVIYGIDGGLVDSFNMNKQYEWNAPNPGLYFGHISTNGEKIVLKLLAQ
ncbi:MAG: T9SS type A sorting domain-containing protein [Reichenbachiella sp.]